MPNYSQGTRLAMASNEEPPYLTVGTDVSAKYKGAFCEAKITDVNKHVKLRVYFDGSNRAYLIDDTDLKSDSSLDIGTKIEAKHPEKRKQTFVQATIAKVMDHSRYTVIFDDGDQCVLRRNSICLKSGKHFAESETLDQLPLTNPEHFGNPVKVGVIEQANHAGASNNLKTQNNHSTPNDRPRGKLSLASSANHHISKSTSNIAITTNAKQTPKEDNIKLNGEITTTNAATTNDTNNIHYSNRKRQLPPNDSLPTETVKKIKKEKVVTANNSTNNIGRRVVTKGRKRRDSTSNGTKNKTLERDDHSIDDDPEQEAVEPVESNIKFDMIEVGVKLMVQYRKGKVQNVYEAKVNKIETDSSGKTKYFVHYTGWNNRYDEWISRTRIVDIVTEKENGCKDEQQLQQQQQHNQTSEKVEPSSDEDREKDKDKNKNKKHQDRQQDHNQDSESKLDKDQDHDKNNEEITDEHEDNEKDNDNNNDQNKDNLKEPSPTPSHHPPHGDQEPQKQNQDTKEPKDISSPIHSCGSSNGSRCGGGNTSTVGPEYPIAKFLSEQTKTHDTEIENSASNATRPTESIPSKDSLETDSNSGQVSNGSNGKDKYRDKEKFHLGVLCKLFEEINEPDLDKKITILQDKIVTLRQTYIALKSELVSLDKRRKRTPTTSATTTNSNSTNGNSDTATTTSVSSSTSSATAQGVSTASELNREHINCLPAC